MTDSGLPFFVRGRRVGYVTDVTEYAGTFHGLLRLEDCLEHNVFASVVALASDLDTTNPELNRDKWELWKMGCGELQDLHLWVGKAETQVEEFSIDSDWSVEWRNMDDRFVGL